MNTDKESRTLLDQSLKETMINTKDAVFSVVDDVTREGFKTEIFTKNNRLYYIGVVLIVLVTVFMIYNSLLPEQPTHPSIVVKLEK